MNYYERHLGDYARDAGHLSMLEHGAYGLLMDRYYATEAGIPDALAEKICRARSKEDREAVRSVLGEFFKLVDGVWINARCESEVALARARIESARENGKKGGRPSNKPNPKPENNHPDTGAFLSGSDLETGSKAHQSPITKHKDQEPLSLTSSGDQPTDLQAHKAERLAAVTLDASQAYNAIMAKPHGLLAAVRLKVGTQNRQNWVRRVIRIAREICEDQYGSKTITREFWDSYFGSCAEDPWLRGEGPYTGVHANWKPDFEVLTRPDRMLKVFQIAIGEDAA